MIVGDNKAAGKQFAKEDAKLLQVLESQYNKRTYNQRDDKIRNIHIKILVKKDHNYYRGGEDNLWNVPTRLSPKYYQYSKNCDKFKKSPRNLEAIEAKYIEDEQEENVKRIQYKSHQTQKPEVSQEVEHLECEDPELFDELAMRKRWTYISKDPAKGLKDISTYKTESLNLVKHLPSEKISKIVTNKVLKFDKESCKMILENILKDQQTRDYKTQSQKIDREQLRSRLKTSHNKTLELEEKCGVRTSFNSEIKRKMQLQLMDTSKSGNSSNIFTGHQDLQNTTQQVLNLENPDQEQFSQTKGSSDMKLKFTSPKKYVRSDHIETLAIQKPEYFSKDFFAKQEFRGLILADQQESIGSKAFKCVEELNDQVLTKFKTLQNFNEQLQQNKTIKSFYKQVLMPKLNKSNIMGQTTTNASGFNSNNFNQTNKSFNHTNHTNKESLNNAQITGDMSFGQNTSRSFITSHDRHDSVFKEQQQSVINSVRNKDRPVIDRNPSINQQQQQRSQTTSVNQRRNIASILNNINNSATYVMRENQTPIINQISPFLTDNDYNLNTTVTKIIGQTGQNLNNTLLTSTLSNSTHKQQLQQCLLPTATRSISTHHQKSRFTATATASNTTGQKQQKFLSVHEFFEPPLSQIEKFDSRFSKTGVRQFKYPNIELQKMKIQQSQKL